MRSRYPDQIDKLVAAWTSQAELIDAVRKIQQAIGTSSGGDGLLKFPMGATVVVAAADSKNKAAAHYVCDGTDDQEEINAAIQSLPAPGTCNIRGSGEVEEPSQGGCVLLLDGTYNITAPIDLSGKSNVVLMGLGPNTVINNLATDGSHAIQAINPDTAPKNRIVIRDLLVQGNPSSGDGIRLENVNYPTIAFVFAIYNGENGIYILRSAAPENRVVIGCQTLFNGLDGIHLANSHEITIVGCHSEENDRYGVYAENSLNIILTGSSIEDNYGAAAIYLDSVRGSSITGNVIEGGSAAAIYITGSPNTRIAITGNVIESAERGISLGGGGVETAIIANNTFSDVNTAAITLATLDSGAHRHVVITGNIAGPDTEGGFDAAGFYINTADNVLVSGNVVYARGAAISLIASSNVEISNNILAAERTGSSPNQRSCIRLDNCSNVLIHSNTLRRRGTSALERGISLEITSGSSDNITITNNELTGVADSTAGVIVNDGATNVTIKHNKAYVTENHGTTPIEGDGSTTTFTIPHGLATTPNYVDVQPKAGAPVPDQVDWDDTNITLTFSTAPASGTYYYAWYAEV